MRAMPKSLGNARIRASLHRFVARELGTLK